MKKFIANWLPPILWMGLIFFLSSRPRVVVSETYIVNFLIFKFLHVVEYALLYFLLFRGFNSLSKKRFSRDEKFIFPIFLSILYAVTDEIHQTFVPTREGKIRDVLIDTGGILLLYSYIKIKYGKKS